MAKFWAFTWILLAGLLSVKDLNVVAAKEEPEYKTDPHSGHPNLTTEQTEMAFKIHEMHLKSDALEEEGKYNESLMLLKKIFPLEQKILGPDHTQPYATLWNAASRFIQLNRANDALAVYWKIYKFRERVSGPTHLKTLEVLHELSRLYISLGKAAKALGFLKKVYKHRKALLGPEHLETIDTLYEIAHAMSKDKDVYDDKPVKRSPEEDQKILSYYKKVLEVRRRELGKHDGLTLATLYDLGTFYLQLGKLEESLEPLQTVVTMRRQLLGEDNPLTFKAKEGLSMTLAHLGRNEEAKALFTIPKSGSEQQEPLKDRVQAIVLEGMAHIHHKRYQEALATFEGAMTSLPENHVETRKILKFLIFLHRHFGNRNKAIRLAKELIDLTRKIDPLNHQDILDIWERMVEDCLKAEDKKQAYTAIYELIEWAEVNFIEGNQDPRLYKVLRIGASEMVGEDRNFVEGLKLYEMLYKVVLKMPVTRKGELKKVGQMIQLLKYNIDPVNNKLPDIDDDEDEADEDVKENGKDEKNEKNFDGGKKPLKKKQHEEL